MKSQDRYISVLWEQMVGEIGLLALPVVRVPEFSEPQGEVKEYFSFRYIAWLLLSCFYLQSGTSLLGLKQSSHLSSLAVGCSLFLFCAGSRNSVSEIVCIKQEQVFQQWWRLQSEDRFPTFPGSHVDLFWPALCVFTQYFLSEFWRGERKLWALSGYLTLMTSSDHYSPQRSHLEILASVDGFCGTTNIQYITMILLIF